MLLLQVPAVSLFLLRGCGIWPRAKTAQIGDHIIEFLATQTLFEGWHWRVLRKFDFTKIAGRQRVQIACFILNHDRVVRASTRHAGDRFAVLRYRRDALVSTKPVG